MPASASECEAERQTPSRTPIDTVISQYPVYEFIPSLTHLWFSFLPLRQDRTDELRSFVQVLKSESFKEPNCLTIFYYFEYPSTVFPYECWKSPTHFLGRKGS